MNYQCILFDLDGTLLDTADDLGSALNHVLSLYGKPAVSSKDYTPTASHGAKVMLQLGFGDEFKKHNFDELRGQFLDYYLNNIATHTRYFNEVVKTLNILNNKDIPWGIVTNKPEFLTTPLLKSFELLENCACVVSGDTVGAAKPDPKPILHALTQMDCDASTGIYVGDAERDIEAGRNAKMYTVAALYGYISDTDYPGQWQADKQINCFSEIIQLL